MVRKLVSATVSAALCMMSVAPALAQEHRFTGFDAPRGATVTLNFRVPLGTAQQTRERMSYGLTLGYGQSVGADLDGMSRTRRVNVADIRFNTGGELRNARLAGFDLANLDRSRAMNLTGGNTTLLVVGGLVVAGVAICLLADCFDGDDEEEESN